MKTVNANTWPCLGPVSYISQENMIYFLNPIAVRSYARTL